MKILHISSSSGLTGGAERSLLELVKLEKAAGIEPVVAVPAKGALSAALESCSVRFVCSPMEWWLVPHSFSAVRKLAVLLFRMLRGIKSEKEFSAILKSEMPDVVHINSSAIFTGAFSARKNKIPVVWHVREFHSANSGFTFANWMICKHVMKRCSAEVITTSEALLSEIRTYLPNMPVSVVYDAVSLPDGKSASHLILSKRSIGIAIIGNIVEPKGQMDIVDGVALLAEKGVSCRAFLVGPVGSLSYKNKIIERAKSWGVNDSIVFTGPVDDVYSFLASIDIVVVSSRSESFGRATIEAMLSGCLVVGNSNTATKELVDRGHGLLYSSDNPGELGEALLYASANREDMRRLAARARCYALSLSDAKFFFDSIFAVFERAYKRSNL